MFVPTAFNLTFSFTPPAGPTDSETDTSAKHNSGKNSVTCQIPAALNTTTTPDGTFTIRARSLASPPQPSRKRGLLRETRARGHEFLSARSRAPETSTLGAHGQPSSLPGGTRTQSPVQPDGDQTYDGASSGVTGNPTGGVVGRIDADDPER